MTILPVALCSVRKMLVKRQLILPVVLGITSLALFARGAGYYLGSGPHDGEDLPSYVMFLGGSILLVAAPLSSWSARVERRNLWIVCVCASSVLLVITLAWWWLDVMLEHWAS